MKNIINTYSFSLRTLLLCVLLITLVATYPTLTKITFFAMSLDLEVSSAVAGAPVFYGFGAGATGGTGKPYYHVTNRNDSGPGSLRDAIAAGDRYVVFDVGGKINLTTDIEIRKANITVDGTTAPSPGITLKNRGLIIRGSTGAQNIIIQNIRVRNAAQDGIWITDAAKNIIIDHISVSNSGDGNLDITRTGTKNITVQWSILGTPADEEKNMLVAFGASRISLHHNIFIESQQRSPQVTYDDSAAKTSDTKTTLDMVNNLIWNWRGGYGTRIRYGARANIVNNYYAAAGGDKDDALIICKGPISHLCELMPNGARAYVAGNVSHDGISLNGLGTESAPFTASGIPIADAKNAACKSIKKAGARPLDAADTLFLSHITLRCS